MLVLVLAVVVIGNSNNGLGNFLFGLGVCSLHIVGSLKEWIPKWSIMAQCC